MPWKWAILGKSAKALLGQSVSKGKGDKDDRGVARVEVCPY